MRIFRWTNLGFTTNKLLSQNLKTWTAFHPLEQFRFVFFRQSVLPNQCSVQMTENIVSAIKQRMTRALPAAVKISVRMRKSLYTLAYALCLSSPKQA